MLESTYLDVQLLDDGHSKVCVQSVPQALTIPHQPQLSQTPSNITTPLIKKPAENAYNLYIIQLSML